MLNGTFLFHTIPKPEIPGNLHTVAENVDSSIFTWILSGSNYFGGCQMPCNRDLHKNQFGV